MGSTDRVRGYARQRGLVLAFPETLGRLTARQQRRVGHKENRMLAGLPVSKPGGKDSTDA